MTWPPGCPRCPRPTAITVGDASGPRACRQLRETETETLAGADRGSTAIGQGALFAAAAP